MRQHKYRDGTALHVGHRITYNGQPGTIVLVADQDEYSPLYPKDAWPSIATGFMITFDNGALLVLDEPDELLVRDKGEADGSSLPSPRRCKEMIAE